MMSSSQFCLLIICCLCVIFSSSTVAEAQDNEYRIIGYYTAWSIYGAEYYVTDIPAQNLTHINYAFIDVSDDGECELADLYADTQFRYPGDPDGLTYYGNIRQLNLLKENNPHLTIMMSISDTTWTDKFSNATLTGESRELFVSSCVDLMLDYGFDGIDVDWEFPVTQSGRAEDKANFTFLLVEFRRQLLAQGASDGRDYFLSIAAPAIPRFYTNIEIDRIHPFVDWINLMGYGYAGEWSDITNHDSALYADNLNSDASIGRNGNTAIQVYLAQGVPADKLVLGVPFYGRGWIGVANENNGMYQAYSGVPQGSIGSGFYPYRDLVNYATDGYTHYWSIQAQASWLYNPVTGITISYEDPQSLQAKVDYVRMFRIGGIMIWELSYDDADNTLSTVIHNGLND